MQTLNACNEGAFMRIDNVDTSTAVAMMLLPLGKHPPLVQRYQPYDFIYHP